MISTCTETLCRRWRRQFNSTRRRGGGEPRTVAVIGFLVNGTARDYMAPIKRLKLVSVFDEFRSGRRIAVRVCVYHPRVEAHGVQWASADRAVAYKDLALRPTLGGRALRMDLWRTEDVRFALDLDQRLTAAARSCRPAGQLHLPRLWAGFASNTILNASGPEFEQLCTRFDLPAASMQAKFRRQYRGIQLLPLDWVSDQLNQSIEVFAELSCVPQRRIVRFRGPEDLKGFQGASEFDFYGNRFRARYAVTQRHASRELPAA